MTERVLGSTLAVINNCPLKMVYFITTQYAYQGTLLEWHRIIIICLTMIWVPPFIPLIIFPETAFIIISWSACPGTIRAGIDL